MWMALWEDTSYPWKIGENTFKSDCFYSCVMGYDCEQDRWNPLSGSVVGSSLPCRAFKHFSLSWWCVGMKKSRLTCCRFKYCVSVLSRQHISLLPAPGLSRSQAFTVGTALLSCHSGGKRKTMACSITSFHEIRKISVRQGGRKWGVVALDWVVRKALSGHMNLYIFYGYRWCTTVALDIYEALTLYKALCWVELTVR